MSNELYDDLASTFALIDTSNKWQKHGFKSKPTEDHPNGQFCMVGAVREGISGRANQGRRNRVYTALAQALPGGYRTYYRIPNDNSRVINFNDSYTTTYRQVKETFQRAMKAARNAS